MSQTPPSSDLAVMQRAIGLARGARGHVWPNPPVGCVIVRDGTVIAEAATHPGGRPHAERRALDMAGADALGAALYVTLEPCCHWGKTPPCADAIIAAGISRVVCAMQDPDPRVNGGGFEKLRRDGIEVDVGLCAEAAQTVMSGFLHRIRTGMPELVICDVEFGTIPEGLDAVLRASQTGFALETRSGVRECTDGSTDNVLRWMVDLGLTAVGVPREDRFVRGAQFSDGTKLMSRCSRLSKTAPRIGA